MKRALKGIAAASVVLGTMAAPMSAYAATTHYNTTKVAHESATTLKSIMVTKTEKFTVTIKDSHNKPIKGALVTFRSSNRSVATASPGDVVTNAKGQATVTITGHKAGTAYFTVTANGVSHKYKVTVTQPAAPTVSITGLSNNQTVLTASQTVTVKSNEKSVKLYLNGKLQSGNGPTFKLTLRDGKNTITAVVTNGVETKKQSIYVTLGEPSVSITGLSDGQVVTTASQKVTVNSNEKSVKLYLNGKLQSGSGPDFNLTLREGKNTITAVATNGVDTKKQSIYVTYNAQLAVSSVNAINANEIVVKFNKPVDQASAEDPSNYTVRVNGSALSVPSGKSLTATLQPDKETVILSVDDNSTGVESPILSNGNSYEVDVQGVLDTNFNFVTPYTGATQVFNDTTAPSLVSASVVGDKVKLTFNKPVTETMTVKIDGIVVADGSTTNVTVDGTPGDYSVLTPELTGANAALLAAGTHTVTIYNATDTAGNVATLLTGSYTATTNSSAPSVVSVTPVSKYTFNVKFSEPITANPTVTVKEGSHTFTNVNITETDSTDYQVTVGDDPGNPVYASGATSAVLSVDITGYEDNNGFVGAEYNGTVTLSANGPQVVGGAYFNGSGQLVIPFNETLDGTYGAQTSDITVTQDDVVQPISSATVSGKDLVITLTEAPTAGTYNVSIAKGAVEDATDHISNVAATVSAVYSAPTNYIQPTVDSSTHDVIKLNFGHDMTNSAITASNYTLDGQPLPTGTTLTFYGNKQVVYITLPANSVASDTQELLDISKNVVATDGSVVADSTNHANDFTDMVSLFDNTAPVLKSAQFAVATPGSTSAWGIRVHFSEPVSVDTTGSDFAVYVNGTQVSVTSVAAEADTSYADIALASPINTNQSVTVKVVPAGSQALTKDADNNALTAGTSVSVSGSYVEAPPA
ncbi:Ig-like domain-containing protein [Alicyclobacillus kakegawensis]|uniref:Ig-like domain-containing protein n=1 Tax=Alicyclobacillus kakegawensis TaxID=392012 RepID=UPI00083324F7|nr:Ig-like domain-containing protein [Alicyclobacillus kakegawensis]